MAQSISYRTVGNTGSLRTPSMNKPKRRDPRETLAMHAAIRAQREAKLMLAKKEKQAKDMWRDQQMAGITDTTFVEKVHGSIHEGAYTWLKEKQMRYGQLTDMLSAEGMNSKNPQWSEIQNERARIKNAYDSFSTNLEGFKAARQEAIDIAGPDIEDGGKKQNYNETATTPQSEKALGFLIDRQFGINGEGEGYGDMQINDDGSFVFAGTTWNGKEIGSKNLPKLTTMPYDKAQDILTAEKNFGGLIKNKTEDFHDEMFQQTVRSSIHKSFRDFDIGQLQAYLLNDMDGEGGTPAFIKHDEIVEGENPVLTWIDHSGKEQEMHYNDLMQSKDAMISFATHNEYEGTKTYLEGMIPVEKEDEIYAETRDDIDRIINDSMTYSTEQTKTPTDQFPYYELTPTEVINKDATRDAAVENFINSEWVPSTTAAWPNTTMRTRSYAWDRFWENFQEQAKDTESDKARITEAGERQDRTPIETDKETPVQLHARAQAAFLSKYPENQRVFIENNEGNINGLDIDPTNATAMTKLFVAQKWITEKSLELKKGLGLEGPGSSPLD